MHMHGTFEAISTARDLQNAANALEDAAHLIQRIARSLEEGSFLLTNSNLTARSFIPQADMPSGLTDEDVEAASILLKMRADTSSSPVGSEATVAPENSDHNSSSSEPAVSDCYDREEEENTALIETFIYKINSLKDNEHPQNVHRSPAASLFDDRIAGLRKRRHSDAIVSEKWSDLLD